MQWSQTRDAMNRKQFYFRNNPFPEDDDEEEGCDRVDSPHPDGAQAKPHEDEYSLMSIDAIINGKVC